MASDYQHVPVLLHEAIDALQVDADGIYVDGTFGRGGHSSWLLERLSSSGKLLVIDQDIEAIAEAESRYKNDSRVVIRHGSFDQIGEFVESLGWRGKVNGVLLDLGVSSPQLDNPRRGFSFSQDGPLDMRMNTATGQTLENWLARVSQQELARVLKDYGEERYAKRIARAIVETREKLTINSTLQLAKIIAQAHPRWEKNKNPATRSFQAMRIYLNQEMQALKNGLENSFKVLAEGGRLVVISFHSLEDRCVKKFIQFQIQGEVIPKDLPVIDLWQPKLKKIGKPIKASETEVEQNPRARSAIMRVAEKLTD